jgi:hypothetical protein
MLYRSDVMCYLPTVESHIEDDSRLRTLDAAAAAEYDTERSNGLSFSSLVV